MIDKESKINKVKLIGTIKNKTANLFWSPQGKTIVLAGLKTMNGQFEFQRRRDGDDGLVRALHGDGE